MIKNESSLHIIALIANHASKTNKYVQSATLNLKPLRKAWFTDSEIKNGGTLVLEMGPKHSEWGMKTPPPQVNQIAPGLLVGTDNHTIKGAALANKMIYFRDLNNK